MKQVMTLSYNNVWMLAGINDSLFAMVNEQIDMTIESPNMWTNQGLHKSKPDHHLIPVHVSPAELLLYQICDIQFEMQLCCAGSIRLTWLQWRNQHWCKYTIAPRSPQYIFYADFEHQLRHQYEDIRTLSDNNVRTLTGTNDKWFTMVKDHIGMTIVGKSPLVWYHIEWVMMFNLSFMEHNMKVHMRVIIMCGVDVAMAWKSPLMRR